MNTTGKKGSGSDDFDFLIGRWNVRNKYLKSRLNNSQDWIEFPAVHEFHKLGALGNADLMEWESVGEKRQGMSVRLYNPVEDVWSIYWVGSDQLGRIGDPIVGKFTNGVGEFFAVEESDGQEIMSRFLWSEITETSARWEQALSTDSGQTWETNWVMTFTRA